MTRSARSKPATSLDVAQRAGVSRATVSNILNGNVARFAAETQARVLDAARELEYRPSAAGRSLVSGRSDTVVILLPNVTFGGNLQDAVDETVAHAMPLGGNVVLRFVSENEDATLRAIDTLRPLAVISLAPLSEEGATLLEAAGTIIVPRRPSSAPPGHPADGGLGVVQAGQLLSNGPRQLWFAALEDGREDLYGPGRLAALVDYCESRELPPPRQLRISLNAEAAASALREVQRAGLPAGLACYNDDVALAALAGARIAGLRVPTEVAIIGVDHTPIGQLWSPRLTTVDPNFRELISSYAAELEVRLRGGQTVVEHPAPRFTIIKGESA